MKRYATIVLVCVSLATLGCADDPGGSSMLSGAPIPIESLCESWIAADCALAIRCGEATTAPGVCQAFVRSFIEDKVCGHILGRVEAVAVSYDAAKAGLALAALASQDCTELPSTDASFLVGLRGSGEACADKLDCAAGLVCVTASSTSGTCTPTVLAGAHADSRELCARELTWNEATGTCEDFGGVGASCSGPADAPCAGELTCAAGKCVKRFGLGEACTTESGWFGPSDDCGAGLFCGQGDTCQALGDVGSACAPLPAMNGCRLGLHCEPTGGAQSGTCALPKTVGVACDPSPQARECAPDLGCVGGFCQPKPTLVVPCGHDSECDGSAKCVSGVCTKA